MGRERRQDRGRKTVLQRQSEWFGEDVSEFKEGDYRDVSRKRTSREERLTILRVTILGLDHGRSEIGASRSHVVDGYLVIDVVDVDDLAEREPFLRR